MKEKLTLIQSKTEGNIFLFINKLAGPPIISSLSSDLWIEEKKEESHFDSKRANFFYYMSLKEKW